jgi:hypothetical protein
MPPFSVVLLDGGQDTCSALFRSIRRKRPERRDAAFEQQALPDSARRRRAAARLPVRALDPLLLHKMREQQEKGQRATDAAHGVELSPSTQKLRRLW